MKRKTITDFQKVVYQFTGRIPRGRVTTYGILAGAIGCRSSRAVGQALKRNPFAPQVPCHRVIASDLSPGGFQGERRGGKVNRKLLLLRKEGVYFSEGRLADPLRIFRF